MIKLLDLILVKEYILFSFVIKIILQIKGIKVGKKFYIEGFETKIER